jgi:hypothetical protein
MVCFLIFHSTTVISSTQKIHLSVTNEKQFNFIVSHSMVINTHIAYTKRKVGIGALWIALHSMI